MWTRTKLLAAIVTLTLLVGYAWQSVSRWKQSLISQGRAEVQAKWDKNLLDISEAITAEIQRTRKLESDLQDQEVKSRKAKDDEISRINARYAALLDSLHNRPDSPDPSSPGVPEGASTGSATGWCDGSRLYRDHAAVLVGEAALAAELQAYARYCVQQYEAVKNQ